MFVAVSSMVIPKLHTNAYKPLKCAIESQSYLKISAALLYLPCKTSGARYSLSPSRSKEVVSPEPVESLRGGLGQSDAIPKSPILK